MPSVTATGKGLVMNGKSRLEGKRILLVDDEPDVLESLADLLPMCELSKATSFEEARDLLESQPFDIAVLDIMGVAGYDLLELANQRGVTAVMLTARAISPGDIKKSFKGGAASYVPKDKMLHITEFLEDILEAREKGRHPWSRWFEKMGDFCEKRFGKDWQKGDKEFWDKMPFY